MQKVLITRKKNNSALIFALACCVVGVISGCATRAPYFRMDTALQKDIKTFGGIQYVPLIKLCDTYSLDWKWDPYLKKAVVEKQGRQLVLRAASDRVLLNGKEKKLEGPVVIEKGAVFIPASFVKRDFGALVSFPPAERPPEAVKPVKFSIKTVVVDAGHGGKDAGAISQKVRIKEKVLTLYAANRLKELLEEGGLRVIMTRTSDTFVSLPKRAEMANKSGADLFVSIHVNASRSKAMNGFECYYLSDATDDNARALEAAENAALKLDEGTVAERSPGLDKTLWDMALTENRLESAELASAICDSVEDSLAIRNRGVRSARFYVLKETRVPGVLVEMGYLSNKYEGLKFKDNEFLDRIIKAVARGIIEYKKRYETTEGFTNI